MKIADIEIAKAVIAHEAVNCFVGKEGPLLKQPSKLISGTGGVFWGKSGEQWPRSDEGKPLIPWLQIVCTEIKGLSGPFYGRKAVCFYIDEEFDDFTDVSKPDGNDFVVREYLLGEKLKPLPRPDGLEHHKFRRVTWKKTQDYPAISKYEELFEDSVYSALYEDRLFTFKNHSGIKIGGWSTPIQTDQRYPGEFDLQIDMTKNYMYGDSGIGYLSANGGIWNLMFECC
jgi:uncharacterized protein YwqG